MKNIELKVSLKDFRGIKELLKINKAKFTEKLFQIDTYFNSSRGLLKTRRINNQDYELIFYQRKQKATSSISNYYRIFLEKKQFESINEVLGELFGRLTTVRKIRQVWLYCHTRIHLDKVHKLGNFLELETVAKKINLTKARIEFEQIKSLLGIKKYKVIRKSYRDGCKTHLDSFLR